METGLGRGDGSQGDSIILSSLAVGSLVKSRPLVAVDSLYSTSPGSPKLFLNLSHLRGLRFPP